MTKHPTHKIAQHQSVWRIGMVLVQAYGDGRPSLLPPDAKAAAVLRGCVKPARRAARRASRSSASSLLTTSRPRGGQFATTHCLHFRRLASDQWAMRRRRDEYTVPHAWHHLHRFTGILDFFKPGPSPNGHTTAASKLSTNLCYAKKSPAGCLLILAPHVQRHVCSRVHPKIERTTFGHAKGNQNFGIDQHNPL